MGTFFEFFSFPFYFEVERTVGATKKKEKGKRKRETSSTLFFLKVALALTCLFEAVHHFEGGERAGEGSRVGGERERREKRVRGQNRPEEAKIMRVRRGEKKTFLSLHVSCFSSAPLPPLPPQPPPCSTPRPWPRPRTGPACYRCSPSSARSRRSRPGSGSPTASRLLPEARQGPEEAR